MDLKPQAHHHFGQGPAATAAVNPGGSLPQSLGRRGGVSSPSLPTPSPEVDLIPASFAGAQQHQWGPERARSSCLQTPVLEKQIV